MMDLELRIIDHQPFFAIKRGKKEVLLPPEQVIAECQQEIANARSIVADLREKEATLQSSIEAAVLAASDATQHRIDLAAVLEEVRSHERSAAQARALIVKVDGIVDNVRIAEIRAADQSAIDAVLEPFTSFIEKELSNV